MLKIAIFDSGYGGELLADYIENELPVVEIIRIIDWRHADKIQKSPKFARKFAELAIRPYLGRVDLIIFANWLVSLTSLKYFRHKYKTQAFIGLKLPPSASSKSCILTTKSLSRTFACKHFAHKNKSKVFALDDWPLLIDDGELGHSKIRRDLSTATIRHSRQAILACSQFADVSDELRKVLGYNTKITTSFDIVLRETCQILKIRGGLKKLK